MECGTYTRFHLKIDNENSTVTAISFTSNGCGYMVAAAEIIAASLDHRTLTDLHGLDQDRAKAALEGFLARVWDEGARAVLVITGKGVQGDGVLRRRAPEWLAAPHLAHLVAGISDAHRRHGGEGALYVALKRKPRP